MDFILADVPKIVFGEGKIAELPGIISQMNNKNVLLVTGAASFQASKQCAELLDELKSLGLSFRIESIATEPSPLIVDTICNKYRSENIDIVVAIGGGSVLDGGKAISAMLTCDDGIQNYLEGVGNKVHSGNKIPFIAVPTTSGTGSETTKNAVISDVQENGFKKSLRHDNFMPDLALVDPKLSLNTPPFQTAVSGLDALSQLIESYTSSKSSVFTDSLAKNAIEMAFKALPTVYENGNDLQARSSMSYAAMISGITLTNSGVGTIHGFASSIGGYFPVPHGVVCGTLIAVANKMNIEKLVDSGENPHILDKYVKLGRMLDKTLSESDYYYCKVLIDTLDACIEKFKIPLLSKFGITKDHVKKIVAATGQKNNPVFFTDEELSKLLLNRI